MGVKRGGETVMEYYVGVDLHKFFFVYYATDERGNELHKGKLKNTLESVDTLLSLFDTSPKVVVEAGCNWMWFVRTLERHGCHVTLAHPTKVKAIASARIKTDSIDAKTLCSLLRGELIPEAHRASDEVCDNRELARARISLVHDQTMLKNRILAMLTKENIKFTEGKDTFGKKGQKWLQENISQLTICKQQMITLYMKRLAALQKDIGELDALIKQKSSSLPEVKLLLSIPAIGSTTAFLLASEIGDVHRFNTAKAFTNYFGLVPRISQSGNHAYYGRITKLGNPYVRWSLVQAAYRLERINDGYRAYVERISLRAGRKKAIVALSRKIACIIYAVLKERRPYVAEREAKCEVCPAIIPGNQLTL